jgi:CheY-like chemotaxis protein
MARVLLVDDDAALLELLSVILSERHVGHAAVDPIGALAMIRSGAHYHLVSCDVDMLRLTGPQLMDAVERDTPEIAIASCS